VANVVFYNLLRSKYGRTSIDVRGDSIQAVIDAIIQSIPEATPDDFQRCVVLYEDRVIHPSRFDQPIGPNDRIAITHFVGGG